jgi:chromosome segregation ATPase
MNTPAVTTTVRKSDEVIVDVMPGQLVIWKFYLESYDIGFQVEVDGETKVQSPVLLSHASHVPGFLYSLLRHREHSCHWVTRGWNEREMLFKLGQLLCETYVVFFFFFSSFSLTTLLLVRNKVLTRQVRVVDPDQYNTAKTTCLDNQRERKKYENQRKSLRHATLRFVSLHSSASCLLLTFYCVTLLLRHAAAVSGVIHSSSVMHEIDEEDGLIINELREELMQAKRETEEASQLLQRTLAEVEDLHEQNNELNTHIDQNAARIAELDEELAHSDHHIDNLEARVNILEQEKADLQLQVKDLTDVVDAASLASQLAAEQKQELIETYTQRINELETKLNQSLGEADSRIQDSNAVNGTLTEENSRLAEELAASLSSIRRLEGEILQLEESLELNQTHEDELQQELSTLREKYDAMKDSEKEVQKLLEIAKERVIQAESTAEKAQEAYEIARQEVLGLTEQIERIKWRSKEEIDEWSERISQLEKELEVSHAEAAASKELLLKEHESQVLSSMEQLQQEISQLKQLLSTAEEQQQELSQQLFDKNEELLFLQKEEETKSSVLTKQVESLERELEEQTASCRSQSQFVESLQQELQEKTRQQQQLGEKCSTLEKELMKTREELHSLSERNAELEQQVIASDSPSSVSNSPQQETSSQLTQSLERALQDLREERDRFDNYRTKKDEESLELHRQVISSQEKLQAIQLQHREMTENAEMERKNRNALLNDSKQELQETKKQLTEALKKLSQLAERQHNGFGSSSRRNSRAYDDHEQDDVFGSDDDEGDHDDLDHAVIVKYHRDLAVARAEIADLAQQLVESAHREDDMQQCITDLQQEISIIMSHMTQFQQQLQLQGHVTSLRQSTSSLLSERNGSSPSKVSGIAGGGGGAGTAGYEMFPTYELIEKYKQLYNETLDRCQALENEIIEERELMNQKVYLSTSLLHDEINQLTHENIELKRELFEVRQQMQGHKESMLKRKTSEINSAAATATNNEMIEKYKGMYLQSLERCKTLEDEVILEKEENSRKYLGVIDELTEELNLLKDEHVHSQAEVKRLEDLLKMASQENEILRGTDAMRSKELQDTQQQLRFIKSTFQDIAKPLNRLLSQDERPQAGLSES